MICQLAAKSTYCHEFLPYELLLDFQRSETKLFAKQDSTKYVVSTLHFINVNDVESSPYLQVFNSTSH